MVTAHQPISVPGPAAGDPPPRRDDCGCAPVPSTALTVAVLLGALLLPLSAQVNTEAMRKGDLAPGLHTSLNLDLGVVGGNSQLLNAKGLLRFDYLSAGAHTVLVGNRQQGRAVRADKIIINKGFVHLRHTRRLGDRLYLEGFLQNEFNDFIRLKNRNLAGGGARIRWLDTVADTGATSGRSIATGLGFMWEQERITKPQVPADVRKDLLRSTNYLVIGWRLDDRLLLQTITYFQFDVSRPVDFRVLFDGSLSFTITDKLAVAIKLSSRYDSEPPAGLGLAKLDFELTSGLAYSF